MLEFRQSQSIAERRRWMFTLRGSSVVTPTGAMNSSNQTYTVPTANGLLALNGQTLTGGGVDYTQTGLTIVLTTVKPASGDVFTWTSSEKTPITGLTGYGRISKNGAISVQTTNPIVEIDSANLPGIYYIEFTAGELNTAGFLAMSVQSGSSDTTTETALITYDDPYAFHGGFPIGSAKGDMQKLNWKKLMEMIRQVVKEEVTAIENVEDTGESEKLDKILDCVTELENREQDEVNLEPILQAISDIKIPAPVDYSKNFSDIVKKLNSYPVVDVAGFSKAVKEFENKMAAAAEYTVTTTSSFKDIQNGFSELQKLMDKFQQTLADQSDMDKRFDAMSSAANNAKIETLVETVKNLERRLMTALVNYKFDILKGVK